MRILPPSELAAIQKIFEEKFDLGGTLPNEVFKQLGGFSLVIGESGDFHKREIFKRLCEVYGDEKLYSLIASPDVSRHFGIESGPLVYSIDLDSLFDQGWKSVDPSQIIKSNTNPNLMPWMLAPSQFYLGSSGAWCSYHERYEFEMDMIAVPVDCNSLNLFGKNTWEFEDFLEASTLHNKRFSNLELDLLRQNYFNKHSAVQDKT